MCTVKSEKGSEGWDLEFSLSTSWIPVLYPRTAQNVGKQVLCLVREGFSLSTSLVPFLYLCLAQNVGGKGQT